MASHNRSMSGYASRYMELRTIPALLGIVFAIASLYQFGGISEVHITWIEYTLSEQHAMFVSLATLLVAFASSETKQFEAYEDWEKAIIAAGPVLIVSHQYVTEVSDIIATNDPTGGIVAFAISVMSWGVAVR